jgi:hypothetical protein
VILRYSCHQCVSNTDVWSCADNARFLIGFGQIEKHRDRKRWKENGPKPSDWTRVVCFSRYLSTWFSSNTTSFKITNNQDLEF